MFASIFIPHFHVQALVRNEPELLEKAVAVVDGTPPMLKVFGANDAALRAGVELGMARLKVEHFFKVIVRQRSSAQEASAHAALLDCANAFSPRVEDTAADTVVIDLEGLERLFGSYHQIAAQIYDQAILVGLQPHVAVASNPDAAIHAARGFEGIIVVPGGTGTFRGIAVGSPVLEFRFSRDIAPLGHPDVRCVCEIAAHKGG
jgi:protein ImuB